MDHSAAAAVRPGYSVPASGAFPIHRLLMPASSIAPALGLDKPLQHEGQ